MKHLPRYFRVRKRKSAARYILSKMILFSRGKSELSEIDTNHLWKMHEEGLSRLVQLSNTDPQYIPSFKSTDGEISLMDVKYELARRIFTDCVLCEHKCHVDRTKKIGWCKVGRPYLSSDFLHMGEEPELIPSHTFFFSGCTLKCVFCQNWDISQNPKAGVTVNDRDIIKRIEKKSDRSVNVNWVGGDPTPNIPFILEVMLNMDLNIPQVWNSNMYLSATSMRLLEGVVDVYLTDFKYGNNECGKRLSKVDHYWDVVKHNHVEASRQGELVVRHLVMPGHYNCCTEPILRFIGEILDKGSLRINVMGQYRPEYKAHKHADIARRPIMDKIDKCKELARDLGLSLCE